MLLRDRTVISESRPEVLALLVVAIEIGQEVKSFRDVFSELSKLRLLAFFAH